MVVVESVSSSVDCASVACQNGLKILALRVCLGEGVVEVEVVVLIVVLVQIEVLAVGKHFLVTCRHHHGLPPWLLVVTTMRLCNQHV